MKKILSLLATLSLLISCQEEQNPVIEVSCISIEQDDMTLEEGESAKLSAIVLPEDADDKTISWSSSDESVVMVSSNGKVMALSMGKAIITAKSGDKSDFITITVEAKVIPVTGVSLDKTQITIKVGESETLTPTITPEDATNKNVSWTSSNDNVATFEDGKVVGLKPGSVTITVTTEDGAKTAECPVTVKSNLAPSETIGVEHISAVSAILSGKANLESTTASDLKVGFQYSTSAGILPSNSITLEASDADVNYNYTSSITGLEPDTKYYFRSFVRQNGQDTYGETKEFTTKDVASLLETRDASGVEATKATLNAKLDLADVKYKDLAYGFLWGTSESALDTDVKCTEIKDNAISAALTGLSHKTQYCYKAYATLDSQTFYGEVKTFTTDVVPVESVSLDKTEYTFNTIGNTLTLVATVLPADATDKSVSWTSDKEAVATVDANGRVTAKGNGKATITVTSKDQGKTASCEVTVAQWVTSISLGTTSLSLAIGAEATLSVTSVLPDNANDKTYSWSSSDSSIASVDNSGKVTARANGNATIKATANDGSGVFASCSVEIDRIYVPQAVDMGTVVNGKNIKWASFNIGASSPEEYGLYYAWGETEPKSNYIWDTYKWCNVLYNTLTKYNTNSSYGNVDNKTVLESSDDVASVKLGGKWRMPTDAEWTELQTKCTWTWTTNYNGTGVKGRIVTATNGNSIFLPAAGYRGNTIPVNAGSYGYYWSSSLDTGNPNYVWYVNFSSGYVLRDHDLYRYYGYSVRPVLEASTLPDITELYLLGGATDNGWSLDTMPKFVRSGNIFSITAHLKAGSLASNTVFRFPMQRVSNTWWPCLVKGSSEGSLAIGYGDEYASRQFTVNQSGTYRIVINVSTMTISIELLSAD